MDYENGRRNLSNKEGRVDAIYELIKEEKYNEKLSKNDEIFAERVSHTSCAILGIILVFGASKLADSYKWANESIMFFSGLTFWLIFLCISLERQSFFRYLWKYGVVKFIISIIFAALLIHANSLSSSTINSVFGVDASAFVYTQSLLTGMLLFKIFIPVFWLVLASCVLHAFVVFAQWKNDEFRIEPILYLVVSLFISAYVLNVVSNAFTDEELRFKAYKMAHMYDFNDKIHCVNESEINKDTVGVYLGPSQNQYLIDLKIEFEEELKEFMMEKSTNGNIIIPNNFKTGNCF